PVASLLPRSFGGDETVERVRAATDIVDLVSRYVPLRRAGGAFKGLCPFHQEKSPSFHVNPQRQIFKCFGCGQGGDVFSFLMKLEKATFPDALRQLAERAGIPLKPATPEESRRRDARQELYRALDWAQRVFARDLRGPAGAACLAYVESRGIDATPREEFGLGYARGGGRALVEYAAKQGVPVDLLERAGLVLKRDGGGWYDRFRDRLTFPIRDRQGRVVAFGARSLDGSEPKYLNSPETDLFQKGRTLYGLDLLRTHRREQPVLVMEGYTDVIMARQAGLTGAVATLGTAFTPAHAVLLRAHADRVVLLYDGDAAGLDAAARAAPLLLDEGLSGGLDLRVATLPDGEDPCDFFVRRGAAGLAELEGFVVELADFLLSRLAAGHDLGSLAGKRRAADEAARWAAHVRDGVSRAAFAERAARALGVPSPTFLALAEAERVKLAAQEARREDRFGTAAPAPRAEPPPADPIPVSPPALRRSYETVVDAAVNRPDLAARFAARFREELFAAVPGGKTVAALFRLAAAHPDYDASRILAASPDAAGRALAERFVRAEDPPEELEGLLEGAFRYLENAALKPDARRLKEQLAYDDDVGALKGLRDLLRRRSSGP
ncbi:MAG TPA: DNA primase, partial [Planctomycetota bacterium]|nr:DNA primase [Planctomycetota bacterium]